MSKRTMLLSLVGAILFSLIGIAALAEERTIVFGSEDVTRRVPQDEALGAFYAASTFQVPAIPQGMRLGHAVLEFYADVDAKSRDGYVNDTPILEVYALETSFSDALDSAELDWDNRVTRPVLLGENQHVVMDVTPIIRSYLASPSANHGLVIGTVTGMREGDVTIRTGELPEDAVMRIVLYLEIADAE